MSQLDARYSGVCRKCGRSFPAGTRIDYVRGAGSSHVTCPPGAAAAPASAGRAIEQLFRETGTLPPGSNDVEGEEIRISSSARIYGGGTWFIVEPAAFEAPTVEEIDGARAAVAPLLAAGATYCAFFDAQRARPVDWKLFYAAVDGQRTEELPEEMRPLAQANTDARAAMVAAKPEGGWTLPQRAWERMEARIRRARDGRSIWYVINNGADGDDWGANNVRTGGAGAIGRRLPWSEELEQRIRSVGEKA